MILKRFAGFLNTIETEVSSLKSKLHSLEQENAKLKLPAPSMAPTSHVPPRARRRKAAKPDYPLSRTIIAKDEDDHIFAQVSRIITARVKDSDRVRAVILKENR